MSKTIEQATPIFGERVEGCAYQQRPGAYAVVVDAERIAVIRSKIGTYYLPGGGIELGETAELALKRELLEECGWEVRIVSKIGEAVEYVAAGGVGYTLQCSFYEVRLDNRISAGSGDHPGDTIEWLSPLDAMKQFARECDAWATRKATSSGLYPRPHEG